MGTILKYGAMFVAMFVSMVLGAFLAVGSCASELLPTVLAADTASVVSDVKVSSADVFDEIQDNIDLVAGLKTRIQEAQLNGEVISLDSVIKDIETITESYERLAGQKGEIRKGLLEKVKKVEDMRMAVDAEVKILREKRAAYSVQLRLVSDPNPEIARTRKEALARACNYVDQQIQLWVEFGNVEKDIVMEMSAIQERLDSFLSMIESTALLFREGLNLLALQRDLNEAIALFTSDLPTMARLTQDLEKSWDNLDYLLNTLTGVAKLGMAQ